MPTTFDLSSLGTRGIVIQGDSSGDLFGTSVSGGGDINRDGFDDLIIGAPGARDSGWDAGEAYVLLGKASGFSKIDITSLSGSVGFIVRGGESYDELGWSVAIAGDVNGDGFDDYLIGLPGAQKAYLVYGKGSGLRSLDLTNLTSTGGFAIEGAKYWDSTGYSVASAGDVNGDGRDDIIIGAPGASTEEGGNNAGEAYVIFGKARAHGSINLESLAASEGFKITGGPGENHAGFSVSSAGDVNGDGVDDLLVGAPDERFFPNGPGSAYVIFGKKTGLAGIDLGNLPAGTGFKISGPNLGDRSGYSVSDAGDVNGDGFDDIIVGVPQAAFDGDEAGRAYVLFGKAGNFGQIDLSSIAASDGFLIYGAPGDRAGTSVGRAGDVNGDGFDDILIGAPFGDNGGRDAGEAYVIFGKPRGFATIDLSNLSSAAGLIIQGDVAGDLAGSSVAGAGDVNGDGFSDVIVGAPGGDDGGGSAGEAYLLWGIKPNIAVIRTGSVASQTIRGGEFNDTLSGLGGNDQLFGSGGADKLDGGAGSDRMTGGNGNDNYVVNSSGDRVVESSAAGGSDLVRSTISFTLGANVEKLTLIGSAVTNGTGNALANTIVGNLAANTLKGGGGNDILQGEAGSDRLYGGTGNDTLKGGSGLDRFYFDSAPNPSSNHDRILDFKPADDAIYLAKSVFSKLAATGTLNAAAFRNGTAAADASDRIIYNKATGNLFYDPDGSGPAAQVWFATVAAGSGLPNPTLTAADFIVF